MSQFLDALTERFLVFDGAFGTWVQEQGLGPDDFGGPALEGCNERLVLTRPDPHRQMPPEDFEAGREEPPSAPPCRAARGGPPLPPGRAPAGQRRGGSPGAGPKLPAVLLLEGGGAGEHETLVA